MSRATLLLAFTCLWALTACGRERPALVHVDAERDAIAILHALAEIGIENAEQQRVTESRATFWRIHVDAEDLNVARKTLVELGLPRDAHAGFDAGSGGMLSSLSPVREHAEYNRALNEEIARKLELLPWVVNAEVMVGLPFKGSAARTDVEALATKASVILRVDPRRWSAERGEAAHVEDVQKLVFGCVAGMKETLAVAVVLDPIDPLSVGDGGAGAVARGRKVDADAGVAGGLGAPSTGERVVTIGLGLVAAALAWHLWRGARQRTRATTVEA
jgi:flagellar biosynthesis/type III secretory pathway M-ring protein FliF/YscJ